MDNHPNVACNKERHSTAVPSKGSRCKKDADRSTDQGNESPLRNVGAQVMRTKEVAVRDNGVVTERDMLIARAVMAYLKTKDPAVFQKAKACIAKTNDVDACLGGPMRQSDMAQLRAIVGQVYWQRAEKHLERHFQIALENSKQAIKLTCNKQPRSQQGNSSPPDKPERYPAFVQTLLHYLESHDKGLSREAKAITNDCVARHQPNDDYDSLITRMKERLKPVVGDFYWKQAETLHSRHLQTPDKGSPVSPITRESPTAPSNQAGQKRKHPYPYFVPSPLTTNIHGQADTSSEFWLGLSQQLNPRAVTNPNEGPSDDETTTNDPFEPIPVDQLREMSRENWDRETSFPSSDDGFEF